MFSFPCARCGHLEIMHQTAEELLDRFASELWPDQEFQEEPYLAGVRDTQDFEDLINSHLQGYSQSLFGQHSFQYRKKDEKLVIHAFATTPSMSGYAPRGLRQRVTREIDRLESEEMEKHGGPWCPPVHTYIVFDRRLGGSFVLVGE